MLLWYMFCVFLTMLLRSFIFLLGNISLPSDRILATEIQPGLQLPRMGPGTGDVYGLRIHDLRASGICVEAIFLPRRHYPGMWRIRGLCMCLWDSCGNYRPSQAILSRYVTHPWSVCLWSSCGSYPPSQAILSRYVDIRLRGLCASGIRVEVILLPRRHYTGRWRIRGLCASGILVEAIILPGRHVPGMLINNISSFYSNSLVVFFFSHYMKVKSMGPEVVYEVESPTNVRYSKFGDMTKVQEKKV